MSQKLTLMKKSFYVLEGDDFFKQVFHVFEEQNGKKYVEELVYQMKKNTFDFEDSPTHSSTRQVGDNFIESVHKLNFDNFYIHGGENVSVGNFLKYIFMQSKNKKLKKNILEIVQCDEFRDLPVCVPREILKNYFDILCED
jgi:F0F1-type ATP synthase gamma subunit